MGKRLIQVREHARRIASGGKTRIGKHKRAIAIGVGAVGGYQLLKRHIIRREIPTALFKRGVSLADLNKAVTKHPKIADEAYNIWKRKGRPGGLIGSKGKIVDIFADLVKKYAKQ